MGKGNARTAAAGQANTQNTFSGLANQYSSGIAMPALRSSSSYFSSLLGSPQQQQSAIAPAAENISAMYGGQQKAIQNYLPMGGERNLAAAQNMTSRASDIARLYAGVQPQAAAALANIGQGAGSLGLGAGGVSIQGGQAAFNDYMTIAQAQANSAMGIGKAIGGIASKGATHFGSKGGGMGKGGGNQGVDPNPVNRAWG